MTTTTVLRWGNGLGVRIPMAVARKLRLQHGSQVEIEREGWRLVIVPLRRPPTLDELLAGVTPKNVHPGVDWWAPAGGCSPTGDGCRSAEDGRR